jgi:hypothetical protein
VAAKINKGQALNVRCSAVDEVMGSPVLNDCSLQ